MQVKDAKERGAQRGQVEDGRHAALRGAASSGGARGGANWAVGTWAFERCHSLTTGANMSWHCFEGPTKKLEAPMLRRFPTVYLSGAKVRA